MTPLGVVQEDSVPQGLTNYTMNFLNSANVSYNPNESVGEFYEDLNNIIGQGIWCDTFHVQNTK